MKMVLLATLFLVPASRAFAAHYGILLMAHGGTPEWNDTVADIARGLDKQAPTEAAFGMADADALQAGVDKLAARGVSRIVAVPLFIHSRSEVMDQTRYALGLSTQPSIVLRDALTAMVAHMPPEHMKGAAHHMMMFSLKQVKSRLPLVMTPALDDSPIVAGVLWRRALALSREPRRETVLLVAHGPVDPKANEAWLVTMREEAERVRRAGNFRAAAALTIRDDAAPSVKQAALDALRAAVVDASKGGGRAIVVPYLIARGGIEDHIAQALNGLDYAWDGRTLCPDPAIERWAAETALSAASEAFSSNDLRENEQNLTLNKLN